jgi:hypothetical protein
VINIADERSVDLVPETLQTLSRLEDIANSLIYATLQGNIDLVSTLQTFHETLKPTVEKATFDRVRAKLAHTLHQLDGHLRSAKVLQKRIGSTTGLVSGHLRRYMFFLTHAFKALESVGSSQSGYFRQHK